MNKTAVYLSEIEKNKERNEHEGNGRKRKAPN
jgi:hypothetical protein